MIEFEDQDYAQHLLRLAERIKNAPNYVKTLPQEELLNAWRWIDDNVFLKLSDQDEKQTFVIVVSYETTILRGLYEQIKSEITRRDNAESNGDQIVMVKEAISSNKGPNTLKHVFMSKKYLAPFLFIITLLLILAVYSRGGKMTALRDLFSYERPSVPTSPIQPALITLTGTISLNGHSPRNGEIMRVYLKDNTLVQPVTPDGNTFVLKDVPMPEDNLVRVALDLQDRPSVSQQFLLKSPKNGIFDLGECTFSSSQMDPTKNPNTTLPKRTQNPSHIEINNPTFNGPAQIGGNGNTQNIEPKPREVSDDLIRSSNYGCIYGETDADVQWFDAPINNSQSKLPLISPGTKVELGIVENGMRKITLPNGRKGWIPITKIKSCN